MSCPDRGLLVSIVAFYSVDPNSNPIEVPIRFSVKMPFERKINKEIED